MRLHELVSDVSRTRQREAWRISGSSTSIQALPLPHALILGISLPFEAAMSGAPSFMHNRVTLVAALAVLGAVTRSLSPRADFPGLEVDEKKNELQNPERGRINKESRKLLMTDVEKLPGVKSPRLIPYDPLLIDGLVADQAPLIPAPLSLHANSLSKSSFSVRNVNIKRQHPCTATRQSCWSLDGLGFGSLTAAHTISSFSGCLRDFIIFVP